MFWFRTITWIALHIGRPVAWALLYPITLFFFLTRRSTRRASRDFLTLALERPATFGDTFENHRVFACTILDRVYLLSGRYECLDITRHGAQPILDRVGAGSSCILLGSHLGSFEVLRSLGARSDAFELRVLMREEQNPTITDFLHSLDSSIGNVVIPLGHPDSMLRVKEAVEQRCLIGLLGDRALTNEKTHRCEFFGRPAAFPTGPMMLAIILQIPIYLFFGLYEGGNRYGIYFELLMDVVETDHGNREAIAAELTEKYATRLMHYARRAPYNWFNFYDFWQASPRT